MMSRSDLLLHLKLDYLVETNKIIDEKSKDQYIVSGHPQIVPDETVGSCLSFGGEGDYIQLPTSISGIKSIAMWVNIPTGQKSGHYFLLDASPSLENGYVGTEDSRASGWKSMSIDGGEPIDKIVWSKIPKDRWTHVYLQAKNRFAGIHLMSGYSKSGFLRGKLANVRLYNKELSQAEIQRVMAEEQITAAAAFSESYPIAFSLYDNKNDQNVLYIDNDVGAHACRVEIVNTSRQNIELLSPLSGEEANVDNHHFELKFRLGTLATDSLAQITLQPNNDWKMGYQQQEQTVSLYFLSKNRQVVSPESKIQLILQPVRVDAGGGARGTRVELKYKNLKYQGAAEPLAGFREEHLGIIDHRGKKNIPLRVDFVGSNTILTDGSSPNTLKLRISNISKSENIRLNPKSGGTPSKFIISFDCGNNDDEWALATCNQINGITLGVNSTWHKELNDQGQVSEWILKTTQTQLATDEHIEITLSNIISSTPSGYANLYVRYENIPGYWDGQFVVPIEKSPLLYRDFKVGINVNPSVELDIKGNVRIEPTSGFIYDFEKDAVGTVPSGFEATNYRSSQNWQVADDKAKFGRQCVRSGAQGGPPEHNAKLYLDLKNVEVKRAISFWYKVSSEKGYDKFYFSYKLSSASSYTNAINGVSGEIDWISKTVSLTAGVYDFRWAYHKDRSLHKGDNVVRVDQIEIDPLERGAASLKGLVVVHKRGVGINTFNPTATLEVNGKIKDKDGYVVPKGVIVMWSGPVNEIPRGWQLCDGTNGTPNLKDRFIVGAGHSYSPGNTGGEDHVTLNTNQIPAHSHSGSVTGEGKHRHVIPIDTGGGGLGWWTPNCLHNADVYNFQDAKGNVWANVNQWTYTLSDSYGGSGAPSYGRGQHYHGLSIIRSGGGQSHENRPRYYALCFIMKIS
jgi:hypothetical protein